MIPVHPDAFARFQRFFGIDERPEPNAHRIVRDDDGSFRFEPVYRRNTEPWFAHALQVRTVNDDGTLTHWAGGVPFASSDPHEDTHLRRICAALARLSMLALALLACSCGDRTGLGLALSDGPEGTGGTVELGSGGRSRADGRGEIDRPRLILVDRS